MRKDVLIVGLLMYLLIGPLLMFVDVFIGCVVFFIGIVVFIAGVALPPKTPSLPPIPPHLSQHSPPQQMFSPHMQPESMHISTVKTITHNQNEDLSKHFEKLKELWDLKESGAINTEEYERLKRKIMQKLEK